MRLCRVQTLVQFQSTPPAEARGDQRVRSFDAGKFQSTPPAEARGDVLNENARGLSTSNLECFNPLPPPKRGETRYAGTRAVSEEVSIHSPRRSEGRP